MGHIPGFNAKKLRSFLADVASLGLKILITELDVVDQELTSDPIARDRIIAGLYEDYLNIVLDERAVIAVLTWGLSEKYTWVSSFYPRSDLYLLFGVLTGVWIPVIMVIFSGLCVLMSIFIAWSKFAYQDLPLHQLLTIPFYIFWKIPVYQPNIYWVLFITIAFTLINKSHYHTLGFQPPQSALLKQSQKK
jgi:hypothetical protein